MYSLPTEQEHFDAISRAPEPPTSVPGGASVMRVQLTESTLAPQSLAADGFNNLDALKDAIRVALCPALDGKVRQPE